MVSYSISAFLQLPERIEQLDRVDLVIFTTRRDICNAQGGSSIRIKGYTTYLKRLGVRYKFAGLIKPLYVEQEDFIYLRFGKGILRLIQLYNIVHKVPIVSEILRRRIIQDHGVRSLVRHGEGVYIWSHQNGSVPLFLKLAVGQRFIYDVHGILQVQLDYLKGSSLKQKMFFLLSLFEERMVFKAADVVNAVSEPMKTFIAKSFGTKMDRIVVARDGFLRSQPRQVSYGQTVRLRKKFGIQNGDRIIFFAGNFKRFGGVHHLVDAFCSLAQAIDGLKIFLVGTGQMEELIFRKIKNYRLNDRFIHIRSIDYDELHRYQQLSTLIVCPDIDDTNNRLTPHIKVFDSILSGRPVVASRFEIVEQVFPEDQGFIKYFEPSDVNDMKKAILYALGHLRDFEKPSKDVLQELGYESLTKELLNQYRQRRIIRGHSAIKS